MAIFKKQVSVGGNWVKAAELKSGTKAVIVSEPQVVPSSFKTEKGAAKEQTICKVKFEGKDEAVNVNLNRPTLNGLIDAFGEDSANWQEKPLIVQTEKGRIGGKAIVALYLIAEGYELVDDANGYATIIKSGQPVDGPDTDLPFGEDDEA